MAVGKAALGEVEDAGDHGCADDGCFSTPLDGVMTRRLNEQVRRNPKRFPDDFLFELTTEEFANLTSIRLGSTF